MSLPARPEYAGRRPVHPLSRVDPPHRPAVGRAAHDPLDESYQGVTFAEFLGEGQKPYVLRNLCTAFFCNLLICDSNYSDRLLVTPNPYGVGQPQNRTHSPCQELVPL